MQNKRSRSADLNDLMIALEAQITKYEANEEKDINPIADVVTKLLNKLTPDEESQDFLDELITKIELLLEESDLLFGLDKKNLNMILNKFLEMKGEQRILELFFTLIYGNDDTDDIRLQRIKNIDAIAAAAFSKHLCRTILNSLAVQAAEDGHIGDLDLLLSLGADHNSFRYNEAEDREKSLLMSASTQQMIEYLIKKGIDLDWQNECGETALIYCVTQQTEEDFPRLDILLQAKGNPNLKDETGKTPLAYVVANLDVDNVKRLIPCSDISLVDKFGNSLFHELAKIMEKSDIADKKILEIAAIFKSHKVDINARNMHGCTPLMEALKSKNTALVKFFIEQGCDLSLVNAFGNKAQELAYLYHKEALPFFPGPIVAETDRMKLELQYGYFAEAAQDIDHAKARILLAQKMSHRKTKDTSPVYAYTLEHKDLNEFYSLMKDLFQSEKWNNLRIFILVTTNEVDEHGNIAGAKHWRCMDFLFTKDVANQKQAKAFVLEAAPLWHNPKQPIIEPLCQVIPGIKVSTNAGVIQHDLVSCAFMALDHLSQSSIVSNFHEQLVEASDKDPLNSPKTDGPKQATKVKLPLKFLRSTQSLSTLNAWNTASELKAQAQAVNSEGKNFLDSVQQHTRFRKNRRIEDKFVKRAKDYYCFIREHSTSVIDKTQSERGLDGFKRLYKFLNESAFFVSDWKSVMLFNADHEQKEVEVTPPKSSKMNFTSSS
ncbi:MAG: ankyrin repeat domain-containing protein [Gammaproteobacteria bacterium]